VQKIHKRLEKLGVEVRLNSRLVALPEVQGGDSFVHSPVGSGGGLSMTTYDLSDGSSISADMLVVCVGSNTRRGNIVGDKFTNERNQVCVQPDLQVTGMEKVFCVGDANDVKETKMGYFASQQAVLAAQNIVRKESGAATVPYKTADGNKEFGVMLVPIGPNLGVSAMGKTILSDYMTTTIKGKGLFTQKYFQTLNQTVPPL
jgi:NADH dehydrogenase FAD-containing subunit